MNATNMVQGNLALKLETPAEPTFTVVRGGRSGFQPLTVKPARNQQAVVAPARVALKVPTRGYQANRFFLDRFFQ